MMVKPHDASTVLLLRSCLDREDIEVLLVLRNRKSSFVPGYYVFPGGGIDSEDYGTGVERFIRGIDREQAACVLKDMSAPEKALGAWVAAVREMFEEVGVLFARKKDGSPFAERSEEERRRFEDYRRLINRKELKFIRMLEAEDLFLTLEGLHYFSHWITPEFLPLRYDVRFFAAAFPSGESVAHDGEELTRHVWMRPAAALEEYKAGRMDMILPQIMSLEELSRFRAVADVIASTRQRNVCAHLTKIQRMNGRDVEVMPDGAVFESRPPVYPRPDEKQ